MTLARSLRRATVLALLAVAAAGPPARAADVKVDLLAPRNGDHVGVEGRGWFVDLAIRFDVPLDRTAAALQLTGPAGHAGIPPLPGTFALGADDRLPGLVVLVSTTAGGARSCQNVANLFNLTGVGHVTERTTEILDTWIVGAANFGRGTWSTTLAAVAADRDGNGFYDDAPAVVPDADGDGACGADDLRALGVASNVARAEFFVNP